MADKSELGESSKQKKVSQNGSNCEKSKKCETSKQTNVLGDCSKCGKKGKYIRSTIFQKLFHYCPECTYNAAFGDLKVKSYDKHASKKAVKKKAKQ